MNAQVKKIVDQMTADKKKLSIMVGLLVVAMLMWGRLLLQNVPRTATAGPGAMLASPQPAGSVTGGVVIRPVVFLDPTVDLDRDLFALDPTAYPRVPTTAQTPRVEKSDLGSTDEMLIAQAVQEAARQLTLQSIVQGNRPRAMINGRLVAQGQTIEGFSVSRIDQRYVVLIRDGVTVRLTMDWN